jgi:hypothetical protein
MATDLQPIRAPAAFERPRVSDDPQLFRFRLRQILLFVAFVSLLLAAIVSSSGLTAAVLILATLVIVFHVLSTSLATQLRSHTDRSIAQRAATHEHDEAEAVPVKRATHENPPRSPWHGRGSTPLPWLTRLIAAAMAVGGIAGAALLSLIIGRETSAAGIMVGSLSLAVVAGWIAFVGYSFVNVFRHGLKAASADERRDHLR